MSQMQNSMSLLGRNAGSMSPGWVGALVITLSAIGIIQADWWFTTYIPGNWPSSNWSGIILVALVGAVMWLLAHGFILTVASRGGLLLHDPDP